MSNNYGAKQYKQTSVATASRGQLLIMLYEAAIKNLKFAKNAIEHKDLSKKGLSIGKAHDIINELSNSLNFDVGGNLAKDLESLYLFMTETLIKANIENDVTKIDSVLKLLENLLVGWRGAVVQYNKEVAQLQKGESKDGG